MKYRLRKVSLNITGVLLLLLISLSVCSTSFYVLKNISDNLNGTTNDTNIKNVKKNKKINEYVKQIPKEKLIEEIDINEEVSSILIDNDSMYESHLFDYKSGEEKDIKDFIKEEKYDDFINKINELVYLKYPSFISDVLTKNDKKNVYSLKENELIIYYYDYEISPKIEEDLFLKVNYNEIKDYLDITVKLDDVYENEDGKRVDNSKKLISFTFDDGPSGVTKELVDILDENRVSATFFMVGNRLESYKDSVKYVYNHGNEIGYHSYAHANFKREKIEDIQTEFNKSNEILNSIIGTGFKLTRPPYGAINDEIKASLETSFIKWNVDTEDWRHHDADYLKQYVLDNIKEGDIILFHDMYKATVASIKLVLPELYARGYQVVTVSSLANHYNVELKTHETYYHFTK